MGLPLLKLNGRDLSQYLRVAHEDGLAPTDPDAPEPTFAGNPAFGDGQAGTGNAQSNYEHVYPLLLEADTRPELLRLVESINQDIFSGAPLEYRHDNDVDQSTFFDVEGGRFEPEYQYRIVSHNTLRGVLRLWTRPYGHTGTARVVAASGQATGPFQFSATGVLGDVAALGNFRLDTASHTDTRTAAVAFGVARSASYRGRASLSAGATTIGASGRVGSQYYGYNEAATSTTDTPVANIDFNATQALAHVGRQRVFAIMRNRIALPSGSPEFALYGDSLAGPSEILTRHTSVPPGTGWNLVDLGEVSIASSPHATAPMYDRRFTITYRGASGASVIASPNVHIDEVLLLPLDISAGVLVTEPSGWTSEKPRLFQSFPNPDLLRLRDTTLTRVETSEGDRLRGAPPRLPPVGSPGPSGPLQVVAFVGDPDDFVANRLANYELVVRERFRFLR